MNERVERPGRDAAVGGYYVYAIVSGKHIAEARLFTVEDATLACVTFSDIGAVIRAAGCDARLTLPYDALRHARIIQALMREDTLLPVRFGTILPNEQAVRALLAERYLSFKRNLARVMNRVELGLCVLCHREREWSDGQPETSGATAGPPPGTRYLRERAFEYAAVERLKRQVTAQAEAIQRRLLPLAVEGQYNVLTDPDLMVNAQYLVERSLVELFRSEVRQLQADQPEQHFFCSGPWAPYNFIDHELLTRGL
ncbi:MAG: GvpL/GvpF family gas vesicle protein [Chloroflexi bacterium]|nr:GvpL/GvpF family gas vesicle protein [Chloroflexota bacterium]